MSQPLSPATGVVHEVRWREICPWLILVPALRVSLLVRVILLALVGILLTHWGWSVLDGVFAESSLPLQRWNNIPRVAGVLAPSAQAEEISQEYDGAWSEFEGPVIRSWRWLTQPFLNAVLKRDGWEQSIGLLACGFEQRSPSGMQLWVLR